MKSESERKTLEAPGAVGLPRVGGNPTSMTPREHPRPHLLFLVVLVLLVSSYAEDASTSTSASTGTRCLLKGQVFHGLC